MNELFYAKVIAYITQSYSKMTMHFVLTSLSVEHRYWLYGIRYLFLTSEKKLRFKFIFSLISISEITSLV